MPITLNSSGIIHNQTIPLGRLNVLQHYPLNISISNTGVSPISITGVEISGSIALISGFVSGMIPTGLATGYTFIPNTSGGIATYSGAYTFVIDNSGFTNHFNWTVSSGTRFSDKLAGMTWHQGPRGSIPNRSAPSGSSPRISYLTPSYKVWFNYQNYEVKNNNLIEFDKVGSNSGSVQNVYVSYLPSTGSVQVSVSITGDLISPTTGFTLSSGSIGTIIISGSPSAITQNGQLTLFTNDVGFTNFTCALKQAVFTGSVYNTQVISSGGFNIFDVVDQRTSQTVCRWHTNYSRANGSVGFTTPRCQTVSTGYIKPGGYDLQYTVTCTGSVSGIVDDLKPIWRFDGPMSMFWYDFRYMGGIIASGTAPTGTWYDNTPYYYPHDADLPFYVLEPSGTNRRIVLTVVGNYYKGNPTEKAAFRLHNYHPTSSASNDIPNPEKHWSITLLSRRASDDAIPYMTPSSNFTLNFSVRVQDQSEDVRDAIFPYRQFFKAAIATGLHFTPNRTVIGGEQLYFVSTHPRIRFFASGITDATGWSQVSGNVYELRLTTSGTENFYWLWDNPNLTTLYPQYPTGIIESVHNTSGSWCVTSGSATGLILRVHSAISNVTGYMFCPTTNKAAYPGNRRFDRDGWSSFSTVLYNRAYSSGWPRLMNWSYGGRSPASAPYSFNNAYDLVTRPDVYISGFYDINTLRNVGSTSGSDIEIGSYWGYGANPQNDFHFPSSNLTEYESQGLMAISKEMDALKYLNMKFVGLDASPPATATYDRALQYVKFTTQYCKPWNPYGVIIELSKADILLPYASNYGFGNDVMKSITVSTGTNTTSELWASGFGSKFLQGIFDNDFVWFGQIRTDLITTSPASLNENERTVIVNKIITDFASNKFSSISLDANSIFSRDFILPTGAIAVNQGPLNYSSLVTWPNYIDGIWVDDVESHKIYRSTDASSYNLLGVATTNSYLDIGLSPETTYYYKISNITKYGRESNLSSGVSIFFSASGGDSFGTTILRSVVPIELRPIGHNGTFLRANTNGLDGVEWDLPCANELIQTPEIQSFSANVSEVWANQPILSGSLTVFYSFNIPINSLVLEIVNPSDPSEDQTFLALNTGSINYTVPISFTPTTPNSEITLILTAANDCEEDESSIIIYGRQKAFYGVSASSSMDSSIISTLSSIFSSNGNVSFNTNATAGKYVYFAFRSAAGTPKFTDVDSGLVGGFEFVENINYSNPYSYSETYAVYKSVYTGLGTVNIQASY